MVIVNFLGHGFQWWEGNNPNPHDFNIPPNNEVRMYIHQAVLDVEEGGYQHVDGIYRDGLYDANDTPPIIRDELNNEFDHIIQQFLAGENCPEHFLINGMNTWNDIYEERNPERGFYRYIDGGQNIGIDDFPPLRFREFGPRAEVPHRFQPDRQFVCSPFGQDTAFTLSWLVNNIRAILTNAPVAGLVIPHDEPIVFRWLVCRQDLHADNLDDIPAVLTNLLQDPEEREQRIINHLIR